MRRNFLILFAFASILAAGLGGCRQSTPAEKAASLPVSTFHLRGKIVSTDSASGAAVIDGQNMPGYMEAMTMSYKFADPAVVSELHPGDVVTADVLVRKDGAEYRDPLLDHIVVVGQARPDNVPKAQYNVPRPGEPVPDFKLVNQSGKSIHLSQYKGRALLLTFIYTRCSAADFCPRMSSNFNQIDQSLAADPKLYAKTHLLSVSFDPANDTPAVLRTYGASHTGRFAKETFAHWEFAAPRPDDLLKVEEFFAVGATPAAEGQISHSLSTVLVGKDGKIVAWYPSNDWKPADVLAQMRLAAGQRAVRGKEPLR